jgi:hypothetical protein
MNIVACDEHVNAIEGLRGIEGKTVVSGQVVSGQEQPGDGKV